MASWIVHLRLAQAVHQQLNQLDQLAFYLGNIAIDSGKVNEDNTIVPPVTISHWTPTGVRNQCRYVDFFNTYCSNPQDDFSYSFYLGCVSHLITDNCWVDKIVFPKKKQFAHLLKQDKDLVYKMKEEWYDLDFLYLSKHLPFDPLVQLETIKDFKNIYLPWFEKDAIQLKLDELVAFYQDIPKLKNDFLYLSEQEMDSFVEETAKHIVQEFHRLMENRI